MKTKSLVAALLLAAAHPAYANVIGSEFQNFNPSLSVTDLTTVHSPNTLGQGRFGLGIFVNAASNTLPYFDEPGVSNRDTNKEYNDQVTGLDLQATYGILDIWDVHITVPSVVAQDIEETEESHAYFKKKGTTEIRFATKLKLISSDLLNVAVVGSANANLVDDNPYSGDVPWPSAALELVFGNFIGPVEWAVNLGHRWRHTNVREDLQAELPLKPFGDQWLASAGVAIPLGSSDWDVIGEVYGAANRHEASDKDPREKGISEGLLGLRADLPMNLQFHIGAGGEMNHSLSSADARVYAGLRWASEAAKAAPAPVTKAPVQERQPDAIIEWDDVYFKFDSVEVRTKKDIENVKRLKAALDARPIDHVKVEGYTCAIGSEEYNQKLSERRANAIESMLISKYDVAPNRLHSMGWGETHPKASNKTIEGRRMNRRVTFHIFYKQPVAKK